MSGWLSVRGGNANQNETMPTMPNQPKTPMRSFRCPDELWDQVVTQADERGLTLTAAVREALEAWVAHP